MTAANQVSHTPGPWAAVGDAIYAEGYFNSPHARLVNSTHHKPQREANAKLIAAAPELMSAAKDMLRLADGLPDEIQQTWFPVIENMRDAIAKATA